MRWGHLSRKPLDAADPPRAKGDGSREMKTWTKEQLKAFLEAINEEDHVAHDPAARPAPHPRHPGAAGGHPPQCRLRASLHATVSITLDTYSHAIPATQEEAAAFIAGLVFTK